MTTHASKKGSQQALEIVSLRVLKRVLGGCLAVGFTVKKRGFLAGALRRGGFQKVAGPPFRGMTP